MKQDGLPIKHVPKRGVARKTKITPLQENLKFHFTEQIVEARRKISEIILLEDYPLMHDVKLDDELKLS